MTDPLAALLALAENATELGPSLVGMHPHDAAYIAACSPEVITALVRVAMATSVVMDYGTVREYPALAQELGALDAALAMEKPAEEPPKVGIDEAVRKFCNMTPEQMRAWIIKHDDPPSCPHGVMAGACPACMGMAGKYRQEPIADPGGTHYDAVEANAICHPECAIAEIKRLRAQRVPTPTDDDLVARMRDPNHSRVYGSSGNKILHEAADRIAELLRDLDMMCQREFDIDCHRHDWQMRAEAAEAERDKWKQKCGDANEWGLIQTARWKTAAETAIADGELTKAYAKEQRERAVRAEEECQRLHQIHIQKRPDIWYWDRRISHKDYPSSEARYLSMEEYAEWLEAEVKELEKQLQYDAAISTLLY